MRDEAHTIRHAMSRDAIREWVLGVRAERLGFRAWCVCAGVCVCVCVCMCVADRNPQDQKSYES